MPTDLTAIQAALGRLSALEKAATDPPWDFHRAQSEYLSHDHIVHVYRDTQKRRCTAFIAVFNSATLNNSANAEASAALRNAAPAMIEAFAALLIHYNTFQNTGTFCDHEGGSKLIMSTEEDWKLEQAADQVDAALERLLEVLK